MYFRKTEDQITVVLGKTDFRKQSILENPSKDLVQVLQVKKIFIHPLFEPPPKPSNDIAILEIKERDIEFTNSVQPICLPPPNGKQYTDEVATALGNVSIFDNHHIDYHNFYDTSVQYEEHML